MPDTTEKAFFRIEEHLASIADALEKIAERNKRTEKFDFAELTPLGSDDELEERVLDFDKYLGDRQYVITRGVFRNTFGRYFPELAKRTREEVR